MNQAGTFTLVIGPTIAITMQEMVGVIATVEYIAGVTGPLGMKTPPLVATITIGTATEI